MGKLPFQPNVYNDSLSALAKIAEVTVLGMVNTCEVVKVLDVDNGKNELTVIPVVKNVDSSDNAIEESPIYKVKYFGWQFGKCAIKAEPKEGDVGFIVISKRDISNINGGVVGSKRKYSQR